MENPKITLSEAYQKTEEQLKQSGIDKDNVNRYKRIYRELQQYYNLKGETNYNPDTNREYMYSIEKKYNTGDIAVSAYQRRRRAVATLEGYINTGQIQAHYSYGAQNLYHLSQHYDVHLKNFVSSMDVSPGTKPTCATISREFFNFMEMEGIEEANKITQEAIQKYITETAGNYSKRMSTFLWLLRKMVGYLKNVVGANVTEKVATLKGRRCNRRVFPALTDDEMSAILKEPDLETSIGKRDYAIILLASYTGLRAVDISNLKLKDINWLEKTLSIVQRKTGISNYLPLEQEVLAAIADYILNGRVNTNSNYAFITTVPPYRPMGSRAGGNIVKKYMKQANITHIPGDSKGFHAIRRRMGVKLLEASMPLEMISQILGHNEMDSAKYYLPMDTNRLKICAMGFDDIPITGGVYYELQV